ncbi:cell wall hydrolase [Nitrosomonas sp.]|uniref:cell wall hydrolase n=1 Tax=Nitrosomonas sp. TaxID=42353 RepID=UPI0025DC63A5|nr:cell wall hydrolase [Nitrosomonas sp.]
MAVARIGWIWVFLIYSGGDSSMRQIWIVTCLATSLLLGQAVAADQARKAEIAESKAEVLEEKAAPDGSKVPPTPAQLISKPQAQAVDAIGEEPLDGAVTCLARSIYWEARGQGDTGMEAVANVVMNRVGHEGFPNTICGVVKQGHEQGACQFSWWCDGRSDDAKENESYAIAKEIARKALNRQLKDRTGGALYFHHRKVVPGWSKEYAKMAEVGEFIFYKPAGGVAK